MDLEIKNKAQNLINRFKELHSDKKLIFFFVAGSHFFDLNSETSDVDFRGIYIPSAEDYYFGESRRKMIEWKTNTKGKNNKNTNEDIDCTFFSLTKFLELLKAGDFNCMEMLHTPESKIVINSHIMMNLKNMRQNLLINDISAFLGFIKKEYKRYGINIYHYQSQENMLNFLKTFNPGIRLKEIWPQLQEYVKSDKHIRFTESLTGNKVLVPSIKIAQRLYQNTVKVQYVIDALIFNLSRYGHRQKEMAKSGVEFKGLYHALRLIYEANDLFDHGEFKIPFNKEKHNLLKKIKNSDIDKDWLFNFIDNEIEKLYKRENLTTSNRNEVSRRIDKLLFKIEGQQKIKYIINKSINDKCSKLQEDYRVYRVGGAIRDELLGKKPTDIDYVVLGCTIEKMLEHGFKQVGAGFPVFLHTVTGEEYALARKEIKTGSGHTDFKFHFVPDVTLDEDLYRRDLTINAIVDKYQGEGGFRYYPKKHVEDLKNKILKAVGPHFKDDPLRVLRLARFKAVLPEFTIDEYTYGLCKDLVKSGDLYSLTPERVFKELSKALMSQKPSEFFEVLRIVGALYVVFPEVHNLIGKSQPIEYHPEGDAYQHTLEVIDASARLNRPLIERFAALCHDLGKSKTSLENLPHHHRHEFNGLPLVENFCHRLKVPTKLTKLAWMVTENHTKCHRLLEMTPQKILKLIKACDGLRNMEYLEHFGYCCLLDNMGKLRETYKNHIHLVNMVKRLKNIDMAWVKDVDNKKKIVEILHKKRLNNIKQYLKLIKNN